MLINFADMLSEVRSKKPLIHHITNYVTVNDCANIVLALGASPVMADDCGEVSDIVSVSSALVLNIGTLNKRTVESMLVAGKAANSLSVPVILDPVGVGVSKLRGDSVSEILNNVKISVLRGNMSEIRFLAGLGASSKGVDASDEDGSGNVITGAETAKTLSKNLGCVVAVTGETDFISDGCRTVAVANGHQTLKNVTGTGCMTTSLVGCYCGATRDYFSSSVAGIVTMGIAGELAFKEFELAGTGSFRAGLIDCVSMLDGKTIERMKKISEI